MDQKTIDGLSPRIRKLVVWLNKNIHRTTDSGDGSNHEEGMECAVPFPMIAIIVTPFTMVSEAYRLLNDLRELGIDLKKIGRKGHKADETTPSIQATFDPVDQTAVIILANVTDEMCKFE